jgi:hypothetical protein
MTTPEKQEHPVSAQGDGDEKGWRVGRLFLLAGLTGLAAGAIILGGRTVTLHDDVSTAQSSEATAKAEKTAEARAKDEIVDRALAFCADASPDQLAKLSAIGLCKKAAEAKQLPAATVAPDVPFSLVKQAVDAYFAANPPQAGPPPTEDVVLRYVRQVYDANRPADGKTPTDAELRVLIQQVYAANPPKNGQNAYCYDAPTDPACQPKQGEPGVSVTDIDLDDSDGCELVVLFSNGTSTRKPVNPALCGPTAPPTTTTATETATVTADPPLPLPTS